MANCQSEALNKKDFRTSSNIKYTKLDSIYFECISLRLLELQDRQVGREDKKLNLGPYFD